MKDLLQSALQKSISYQDYRIMVAALLATGKTTGDNHSEAYLGYTNMNEQRMNRLEKTITLSPEMIAIGQSVSRPITFLVLVEAWCGDVAQNLPILEKIAAESPNISLKMVLRDENLDLMDKFLTNGGRSIPKLIMLDDATLEVLGEWGPRPAPAQQLVMDYKAQEVQEPYQEFVIKVQKWYRADKGRTIQQEFSSMLMNISEAQAASA